MENRKIEKAFSKHGYKSLLYRNNETKQFVLAFQGATLKVRDFFIRNDNQIASLIESVLGNMNLATQSYYAFLDTLKGVESCRENNCSLSFTGYGFGAWLAEQSVFFAQKDFKFHDVKAVTFESPGSFEYLNMLNDTNVNNRENYFDLNRLDITTYLSSPNFVNTCNKHLGKVFRIFSKKQIEINK